jgi:O-antigen/teichoic acid export membrane protein
MRETVEATPAAEPPSPDQASVYRHPIRRFREDRLLRNGTYIMGITAVPSGLGFGFWVLASHALSTAEVGRAAALVSAMLFVSIVTNLGIGQVFVTRLPSRDPGHEWSLTVTTGLLVVTASSLACGAIASLVAPLAIHSLRDGVGTISWILLPFGVAGIANSLILDHVCIAERHARPAFVRNAFAALMRLVMIAAASLVPVNGTDWIMIAWVGSFVLIDVCTVIWVLPTLGHRFKPTLREWRTELAAMSRLIAGHQSINLGAQLGSYLLPLIVAARLGPSENAYFYTTFLLANALFFVAPALSDALFAEGAHNPAELDRGLRRAVRYILCLAGIPALALLLGGELILSAFGPEYAAHGTGLLRVLVACGVFAAGLALAVTVLRVRQLLSDGAIATLVALVVGVLAAWFLLPPLGLPGAGVGWGLGQVAGLAVAGVFLVARGWARDPAPG